jgi:hypothetical protein
VLVVSLCSLFTLGGCGGLSEEAQTAQDAEESVATTSTESALTSELSDEVGQPSSAAPEALAQSAATRVVGHLTPAGCATTTVSGATVTYVLHDCTGPYGLVHVTGTVQAVYAWAQGSVQAVVTATGLQANQATLDVNATVVASAANGVKQASVVASSSGTGARGIALEREGTYTVTYDTTSGCHTIDGTWTTKAGALSSSTVVAGYARCQAACPKAGGSVVHTTRAGKVFTLTYDGTASAEWSASTGRTGTVALSCTP